ncbi:7496_t:CDS:2 [Gigaspora margarita]|uniref:7496_t:CDS:1 n=1 Tax=Gigaspora margarita TaxID=4874 RepID=A0ABN7VFD4_GIGMA|nr:7496_t:CDS:2 [Gigaspora margarita]
MDFNPSKSLRQTPCAKTDTVDPNLDAAKKAYQAYINQSWSSAAAEATRSASSTDTVKATPVAPLASASAPVSSITPPPVQPTIVSQPKPSDKSTTKTYETSPNPTITVNEFLPQTSGQSSSLNIGIYVGIAVTGGVVVGSILTFAGYCIYKKHLDSKYMPTPGNVNHLDSKYIPTPGNVNHLDSNFIPTPGNVV